MAHPAPQTYTIDLATACSEVIQLSADGWKVTTDFDTRFFRPDNSVPFQPPVKVKTKLHQALQDIFNIQESKSKQLSTWLVDALLQNQTQPTLIITGKFRHEAVAKLRAYVDPSVCPVHTMPATRITMGRLAITNRVMAFDIYKQLSPSKIEMLNQLRTGMIVELKQVSRNSEAISTLVRRPIILSAEQAPKIHETQIEIEVDEIAVVERCELLSALLDAAVHQIRQLQEREERQVYLEWAAPEMAGYQPIEEYSQDVPGP